MVVVTSHSSYIKCIQYPLDACIFIGSLIGSIIAFWGIFSIQNIVLNIDIAPTLLDMAGVATPEHMDGKSIMELFDNSGRHGKYVK